jgi:hypothetical protein
MTHPDDPIDLPALNEVLATVQEFPASSGHLAQRARQLGATPSVIEFFESIPGDTTFSDKADVLNRSYTTGLIMAEEQAEPEERVQSGD